MKLRIKSTHNPAIFRGTKYDRIVAGTITEVNGEPWNHAYVAIKGKINIDDIEWVSNIQVVPRTPKEWKVKSSRAGKFYTVRQTPSGQRTCDCDGFMYRRKCRHVKM